MTYENVVSWCEKNLPQENYDSFSEWYDASYEKVNTPNLFENKDFNRMMEDSWLGNYGTFQKPQAPIPIPSGATIPSKPVEPIPEAQVKLPPTGQAPELPRPQLVFPAVELKETRVQKFKRALRGLFRR